MTAWAAFYPLVLPWVPGCPEPAVDLALRNAAREFCMATRRWQEQAAAQTGDGTTQQFALVLPTGAELVRVERCTVAGEDMDVLSASDMPADWQESDPDDGALTDKAVVLADNTGLLLYPTPADGDAIVIYQALKPTVTAAEVGDVIYDEHAEDVAHGALSRLMRLPGQSWTNFEAAAGYRTLFNESMHPAANWAGRQAPLRTGRTVL